MKTFDGDFNKFLNKIKNKENFSLSRWGDGELKILDGEYIDLLDKGNGEFKYDPNLEKYSKVRNDMLSAYIYNNKDYYVGIACSCCVGKEKFEYMKKMSKQKEENLTWANIFVNSNYKTFITEYIPEFKKHNINLIINKNSNLEKLPFNYKNVWYVGSDAWLNDYDLIAEIYSYILIDNIKNELFLFAAGPFSNILAHKLWLFSEENTYIDIGSVLDPYLGLKLTRGYHNGAETLNKICIW